MKWYVSGVRSAPRERCEKCERCDLEPVANMFLLIEVHGWGGVDCVSERSDGVSGMTHERHG